MKTEILRGLVHESDGCREFDAELVELALTGAAASSIEEHVARCARCEAALAKYRSTEQALHSAFLDAPHSTPSFRARRLRAAEVLRAAGYLVIVGAVAWIVRVGAPAAAPMPTHRDSTAGTALDLGPALAVHPVADADVELLAPHHARIDRGQSAFTIHDPRSVVDTPVGPLSCDACEFSVRVDPSARLSLAGFVPGSVTVTVMTGLVGGTLLFTGPSPFVQLGAGDSLTLAMPGAAVAADPAPAAAAPTGGMIADGTPKLVSEERGVDFGPILQGEVKKHTFVLENQGDGPALVTRVATNCGCTLARVMLDGKEVKLPEHTHFAGGGARDRVSGAAGGDKTGKADKGEKEDDDGDGSSGTLFTLDPGKKCEVIVEYNSGGQPPQVLAKRVVIHSNDPDNPRYVFDLKGEVKTCAEMTPKNIGFGPVVRGAKETRRAVLSLKNGADFKITSVENAAGAFDVKVARLPATEGAGYSIDVSVLPDVPVGTLSRMLVLMTDHPTVREIKLPVAAEIVSAVRVTTDGKGLARIVDFGTFDAGTPPTRSITIDNANGNVPWTPTSIELDPKEPAVVKFVIVTLEAGKRYRIDLTPQTVPGTPGKTSMRTTLVIHADHPETKELRVSIIGRPK